MTRWVLWVGFEDDHVRVGCSRSPGRVLSQGELVGLWVEAFAMQKLVTCAIIVIDTRNYK